MIEGRCLCGCSGLEVDDVPEQITACSCSTRSCYGVIGAYDYADRRIQVFGKTKAHFYDNASIGFHHCADCGCVTHWLALETQASGFRRIVVNLRPARPDVWLT